MTTKKNKKDYRRILFVLLVVMACATVFNSCNFGGGGGDGGGYQPTDTITKSDPETEVKTDDIISDFFNLTEEDLEYLKEHPIEVTPENSPGNPAFIDVGYTEEDLAQTYTYSATVSQETPETDIPELGIHVNFKSWNLDYEEDTLVVTHFPDKFDENTGMILHTYGYYLASGQNQFCTDVEITAPVPCDPDMFGGFVSYNQEKGVWEDVYCELAEDRSTYTAYMSHFSLKSVLEKIKAEGMAAINLYQQDGKSLFVQQMKEMQPKYEESSHYLYPVAVSSAINFEKFFAQKTKKDISTLQQLVLENGAASEKTAFGQAIDKLGFANDVVSNTDIKTSIENQIKRTFKKASAPKVKLFGVSLTAIGQVCLALTVTEQLMRGVDTKTIYKENATGYLSTTLGIIGSISEHIAAAGWASKTMAAGITWTTAAGVTATVASVAGAALFVTTIMTEIKNYETDKTYPLGQYTPISIADAACHCYIQEYARSDRGYIKNRLDESYGYESPKIDSFTVYSRQPQKLLDLDEKNWLLAYECLLKNHTNPETLIDEYDSLYSHLADAFWNENKEVQKKYFHMACKKYIKINMYDRNGMRVFGPGLLDAVSFQPEDISKYHFDAEADADWRNLQNILILSAQRTRTINVLRTLDEVWDGIFIGWDELNVKDSELTYLNKVIKNEKAKKKVHDRTVALLKNKTAPFIRDYYNKKHREGILEVKKKLDNEILPLLNTRLTFYARNREKPDGPYSSIVNANGTVPSFAFKCDTVPQFQPRNSEEVGTGFHLNLKANDKNAVLLETTVYHYLMYGCPENATIKYYRDDGEHTATATANWTNVKLVKEAEQAEWSIWNIFGKPQVNIEDTKVPIEYGMQTGKKLEFVRNQFDLGAEETSEAITTALTKGSGSVSSNSFSFSGSCSIPVKEYMDQSNLFEGSYTSESGSISASVEITGTFDPKTGKGTCDFKASETQDVLRESVLYKNKTINDGHRHWTNQGKGTVTMYDDNTVRCDINGTSKCEGKSDVKGYHIENGGWVIDSGGNRVESHNSDNKSTRWNLLFKIAD